MSLNPYKRLIKLLPGQPVDTGEIIATDNAGVTVQLQTGAIVHARGEGMVGEHVYIRNGAVDGPAPDLSGVEIEI